MRTTSKAEALERGLRHYFTGKPCRNGHIFKRLTSTGHCLECGRINRNNYYKRNSAKIIKETRLWESKNKENKSKAREYKNKSLKKYWKTSAGKLRRLCSNTSTRLKINKIPKSTRDILLYTPEEFSRYLLKDYQFKSVQEAQDKGYCIDHIVPVSYISSIIDDFELAFKMAMDLKNLRLITISENSSKNNKLSYPEVEITINYLCNKYIEI